MASHEMKHGSRFSVGTRNTGRVLRDVIDNVTNSDRGLYEPRLVPGIDAAVKRVFRFHGSARMRLLTPEGIRRSSVPTDLPQLASSIQNNTRPLSV